MLLLVLLLLLVWQGEVPTTITKDDWNACLAGPYSKGLLTGPRCDNDEVEVEVEEEEEEEEEEREEEKKEEE